MIENTQMFWSWNSKTVLLYLKSTPSNLSTWKIWGKTKTSKFGIQNVLFGYVWAIILKILYSYLKSASSSLSISKIGRKTPDFGIFGWNLKQYCHIWNQLPRICVIVKFGAKNKNPNFRTKNALFGFFWPKSLILQFFGKNCEKPFAIFEISTLKFVCLQNFTKKQ